MRHVIAVCILGGCAVHVVVRTVVRPVRQVRGHNVGALWWRRLRFTDCAAPLLQAVSDTVANRKDGCVRKARGYALDFPTDPVQPPRYNPCVGVAILCSDCGADAAAAAASVVVVVVGGGVAWTTPVAWTTNFAC